MSWDRGSAVVEPVVSADADFVLVGSTGGLLGIGGYSLMVAAPLPSEITATIVVFSDFPTVLYGT